MRIRLSDHFNYGRMLRFTLPSIVMMVFTSVYGVVDGLFVSNFAGKDAFTAINLIFPYLMIVATVGFMFGTGGSALVSKTMGEGDKEKANGYFSLLVYTAVALSVLLGALSFVFLRPIAVFLGRGQVSESVLDKAVVYGRILLCGLPFYVLQMMFQSFFVTAEKPKLGLVSTLASGGTNIALDALLVILLPQEYKLIGAAVATAASQFVGGIIPICYFFRKNKSLLRLGKTKFSGFAIGKTCVNGSSEFMSNVSMNVVAMLYNMQLLRYAGENGVAAYGVLMYVSFIFAAAFLGYTIGVAPVVGYHFGARNHFEIRGLLKKSSLLVAIGSLAMLGIGEALALPLSKMFVGYDEALLKMTVDGFRIFAFSFLFMGFAIFASGFFTALNDGVTSAIISFLRTLVFQVAAVMLLPLLWGLDGIWYSVIVAEFMAAALSWVFLFFKRKKYHYLGRL